jgi:hypothetical protein
MANTVNVTTANTFEEWRVKTNELGTAIGDLDTLTAGDSGAATIVAALNIRDNEVEANTAIIGTAALWDTTNYGTLRKAANKNHADIETIAATLGISGAFSLSGYNGSETTLVAILNAQRAVDIASDVDIASNDTDIATINTKLGTITAAAMGTTAATVGPAILELHGELTTATTNIAGIGTTYVAVAGDTMTGTLISASSGLSGSTAGVSAATKLTLGTGSATAITVDSNQRIGIGKAAHATHKVDVNGNINATTLSYGGTDLKSLFYEQGEVFQDAVGAMVTGSTQTNGIGVTYDDTNGEIDFAITGSAVSGITTGNITALQEYIEDTVGAMVASNVTEEGIIVEYVDNGAAAGKLTFSVGDPVIELSGDVVGQATMNNLGSIDIVTSLGAGGLAESIQDVVGGMVGSNTETGINVTYDDNDGTLDFVIGNDLIERSMLKTEVELKIINSAGDAVKTLYGAGA